MAGAVTNVDEELLVIGAGVGRTGTNSLKQALELIYGRPCYHMFELIENHSDHANRWVQLDRLLDKSTDGQLDPELFRGLYKGYRCAVDFPTCAYYPQLMRIYRNAKFILTTREPRAWLQSVRSTILPRNLHLDWADILVINLVCGRNASILFKLIWQRAFGTDIDLDNDEALVRAFEQWNRQVQQDIPPERLLVYNVKEGWAPLCKFLNVPEPQQPFPHVNSRAEHIQRSRALVYLPRIIRWTLPMTAAFLLGLFAYHYMKVPG